MQLMVKHSARTSLQRLLLVALFATLSACGGGGSSGSTAPPRPPPPPVNTAPTVNAGPDRTVVELNVVQLDGSANDVNSGDTLTFSWSQIAGMTVTLTDPDTQNASFTAPDVPVATSENLTFQLSVSDGAGGTTTDDVVITIQEAGAPVVLSGTVEYEFPPPNNSQQNNLCNGLNFNAIVLRPVRGATVQIIDPTSNTLINVTTTDQNGFYSITLDGNTDVFVRIVAEAKRSGNPSWDVEIRDNVTLDPNPLPLSSRPQYFLDSTPFSTGGQSLSRNLIAATGWTGVSYTEPRAAAPFAVLDTIYSMMQLVVAVDPGINFPALDAFWSINNRTSSGTGNLIDDINSGDLSGVSFYLGGSIGSLFLLGEAGVDTEEFDDHVIGHEWGHYFEDRFSRSDSIGGSHSIGDQLDMRVAFGEGFATALSGMGLNDPVYCDTFGNTGFDIDIEGENGGFNGWFNESSVIKILYDLWDNADEGNDTMSIGFGPIYEVLTGPQRTTAAFTSIFSFAEALKALPNAEIAFIDAQLGRENIVGAGINLFGVGETNDSNLSSDPNPPDVLPVYTDISVGVTERICSNSRFDSGRAGNKLSEVRFLKLELQNPAVLTFTVDTVNPQTTPSAGFDCVAEITAHQPPNPPLPANSEVFTHSDPDFEVWRTGQSFVRGFSCQPNQEVSQPSSLSAGTYVIDLTEFRYASTDTNTPGGYPEQTCFDVTISQ